MTSRAPTNKNGRRSTSPVFGRPFLFSLLLSFLTSTLLLGLWLSFDSDLDSAGLDSLDFEDSLGLDSLGLEAEDWEDSASLDSLDLEAEDWEDSASLDSVGLDSEACDVSTGLDSAGLDSEACDVSAGLDSAGLDSEAWELSAGFCSGLGAGNEITGSTCLSDSSSRGNCAK